MPANSLHTNILGGNYISRFFSKNLRSIITLTFIVHLSACGGGSSSNDEEIPDPLPTTIPVDTITPTITLNGDAQLTIEVNTIYTDLGATATDDVDGTINVITENDAIDTSSPAVFTITYTATDTAGNTATATRTVNVVDTTAPILSLVNDSTVSLIQNNTYSVYEETGASAFDNVDGEIEVMITDDIDTTTQGNYTVTYTATDSSGNKTVKTRVINVIEATPFITVWKTDVASGADSNDNQIHIGTIGGGYNFTIDWGDGTIETNQTADEEVIHTYAQVGTYEIKITGQFPRLFFDKYYEGYDNTKLMSVEQWGNNIWQSMENAFYEVELAFNNTDIPDLSQVTNMSYMFYESTGTLDNTMSDWDVSNVTNMSHMFKGALSFNQDISTWDVSNVTDMSNTFNESEAFNQDIGSWNVSNVLNMKEMFDEAEEFNQDISEWDVSKVTNMSGLFNQAQAFNQNINDWNVSNVTDMNNMFAHTRNYNQPLNEWNVSNVTDMNAMFNSTRVFNQDLSGWDVSNVTDMSGMFNDTRVFNQDISQWNTASLIDTENMFNEAAAFDQNLGEWDMSNVTDMTGMLVDSSLSTANYDALLIGWSMQTLQTGVTFDANNSYYSSSAVEAARQSIINVYLWVITDSGLEP